MRRERDADVRDVRVRLASQDKGVAVDLTSLIGIENLLSTKIMGKVVANRKAARQAVFDEQARQQNSSEYNLEEIARASRLHTSWSEGRARKVGLLNSQL